MSLRSRSRWYLDGYEEGKFAAIVNLETSTRAEMFQALHDDRLGEIAGQVRDHQVQMAGDISYDVGRPLGPTERQYESWESGFYDGFADRVKHEFPVRVVSETTAQSRRSEERRVGKECRL